LLATPKEPRPGRCAGYGLDRAAAGTTVRGAGLLLSAVALPGRGRLGGRRRRALLTRHGFVLLHGRRRMRVIAAMDHWGAAAITHRSTVTIPTVAGSALVLEQPAQEERLLAATRVAAGTNLRGAARGIRAAGL